MIATNLHNLTWITPPGCTDSYALTGDVIYRRDAAGAHTSARWGDFARAPRLHVEAPQLVQGASWWAVPT